MGRRVPFGSVKRQEIEAFLGRNWEAVASLKADYWAERKRSLTPTEALAIGDRLRRHTLTLRADWPSESERIDDLAVHRRVSESFRHVRRSRGR